MEGHGNTGQPAQAADAPDGGEGGPRAEASADEDELGEAAPPELGRSTDEVSGKWPIEAVSHDRAGALPDSMIVKSQDVVPGRRQTASQRDRQAIATCGGHVRPAVDQDHPDAPGGAARSGQDPEEVLAPCPKPDRCFAQAHSVDTVVHGVISRRLSQASVICISASVDCT